VKRAIFISYRRDDSEGEAGRLYDDLVRTYGDDSVFMDVAGIDPGSDFRKAIDDNVTSCGVFLAIIGPHWATVADETGQRRLDNANDFVRLEVASALARNIAVIPVLVHDARMPRPEQLPDPMKDLAFRNSVELSHARWNSDVQLLIKALKQYVSTDAATEAEPVHATVPVQLPPPVASDAATGEKRSATPLIIGGVVAVVLIAVVAFFLFRPHHPEGTVNPFGTTTADQANALTGNWRNPEPQKVQDALVELKITGSGPAYNVEPFGQCPSGECSWGLKTVYLKNGEAVQEWEPRNVQVETDTNRTVRLTLKPVSGDSLAVVSQNIHESVQANANGAPAKTATKPFISSFVREK
jgi:TIR domain